MKKRNIPKGLIAIFTVSMITACTQTYEDNSEKVTLQQIYEGSEQALNAEYDNLTMPDNLYLTETDKLYTFDIKQSVIYDDTKKQDYTQSLIKLIDAYSGKTINDSEISFNSFEDENGEIYHISFDYSDSESSFVYSYNPNGTFSITDSSVADDIHGGKCLSYYLIEPTTDIKSLKGMEGFPISEAIDISQKQVAEKLEPCIAEDKLKLYSVSLFITPNGSKAYYIIYRKEYHGLELSESGEFTHIDNGFIKPTYLAVQLNSEKEIYKVINMYSNEYDEGSVSVIEDGNFISLDRACELLSDYLAKYNTYEIENIDLVYFLPTRFIEESSQLAYVKYIPGYEITLKSKLADENNSANPAPRITAYIDVVTGDIYLFDTITNVKHFTME